MDIAVLWFSMHVTHMSFVQIVCIGSVVIAVQYAVRDFDPPSRWSQGATPMRLSYLPHVSSHSYCAICHDGPHPPRLLVNRDHFASDRCAASVATNIVSITAVLVCDSLAELCPPHRH